MHTLVIDTSIIIKWLNQDGELNLENANQILRDAQLGYVDLLAPELAKYEVGNVLITGKKLSTRQFVVVHGIFHKLPITYITETPQLGQTCYAYANKLSISYYDAAFLTLADHYEATLVTDNMKHQGKPSSVTVMALKDYKEYTASIG